MMVDNYLPVLLQLTVVIGFAVSSLVFSVFLGKSGKRSQVKDSPYECGMLSEGNEHARFSVKFYLVAMLFVLFDIEVVFLYPWAVIFKEALSGPLGIGMFWSMLSFVGILTVAYIYAIKKGALNWKT